jgi:hypothetical protein
MLDILKGMDLQEMLKDAALVGLAVGVIVMAAVTKPPFGFCL